MPKRGGLLNAGMTSGDTGTVPALPSLPSPTTSPVQPTLPDANSSGTAIPPVTKPTPSATISHPVTLQPPLEGGGATTTGPSAGLLNGGITPSATFSTTNKKSMAWYNGLDSAKQAKVNAWYGGLSPEMKSTVDSWLAGGGKLDHFISGNQLFGTGDDVGGVTPPAPSAGQTTPPPPLEGGGETLLNGGITPPSGGNITHLTDGGFTPLVPPGPTPPPSGGPSTPPSTPAPGGPTTPSVGTPPPQSGTPTSGPQTPTTPPVVSDHGGKPTVLPPVLPPVVSDGGGFPPPSGSTGGGLINGSIGSGTTPPPTGGGLTPLTGTKTPGSVGGVGTPTPETGTQTSGPGTGTKTPSSVGGGDVTPNTPPAGGTTPPPPPPMTPNGETAVTGGQFTTKTGTGVTMTQNNDGQDIANANTTVYNPTDATVDPGAQTIAGQLNSLLSNGSPYLDRAQTAAEQYANSRGLLNSSIAAGAGQAAAIDAALPIATGDANIYNTTMALNKQARDTAGLQGATAKNSNSQANANATNTFELQNLKGTQATDLALIDAENKLQIANLDNANKVAIENIDANYKQLLQTSQDAQQLYSQFASTVSQIMTDPYTAAFQKQQAVDQLSRMLESGLHIIGSISNTDLTSLLDFSNTGGTNTGGTAGGAGGTAGGTQGTGDQQGGAAHSLPPLNQAFNDPSNQQLAGGFLNAGGNIISPNQNPYYDGTNMPDPATPAPKLDDYFNYQYGGRGPNPNPYFSTQNREQLRSYAMQLGLTSADADRAALQVAQQHFAAGGNLYDEGGPAPEVVADEIAKVLYTQSGRS